MSRWRWIAAALACSCAALVPVPLESSIDATYRWQKAQGQPANGPANPSVSFYRSALRRTIAGQCSLYPSESELAQWRFHRCEIIPTTLASMARWYMEPDAAFLALPTTLMDGRLRSIELPPDCWPSR